MLPGYSANFLIHHIRKKFKVPEKQLYILIFFCFQDAVVVNELLDMYSVNNLMILLENLVWSIC